MSKIQKKLSRLSVENIFKSSYNDEDSSLTISGFVSSKIGNRITVTIATTNVPDDTEIFSYFENTTTLLYTLTIIYSSSSRDQMLSAQRTA